MTFLFLFIYFVWRKFYNSCISALFRTNFLARGYPRPLLAWWGGKKRSDYARLTRTQREVKWEDARRETSNLRWHRLTPRLKHCQTEVKCLTGGRMLVKNKVGGRWKEIGGNRQANCRRLKEEERWKHAWGRNGDEENTERMKSDIVDCSGSAFTQLGTLVPFVMKESAFSADNGWEDSTLYGQTGSVAA